jgi:hypothetical protein
MRSGSLLALAAAVALAAAARLGGSGAVTGAAVGLAVGAVYAGTLLYGFRRAPRLGAEAALRLVQIGGPLRLAFALAAFGLAARLLPRADLGWGAATVLLPLLWSLVRVAREGARA